jgi:hypothetical protein
MAVFCEYTPLRSMGKPLSSLRVKRTVIGAPVAVLTPPGAIATTMPVLGKLWPAGAMLQT